MRDLRELDAFRNADFERRAAGAGHWPRDMAGAFVFKSPIDRADLRVLASRFDGWDHASVSRVNRCPNWPEMDFVKRQLFHDSETAMQLHVPPEDHVNNHRYCLHLWRAQLAEIPRPPVEFVGVQGVDPAEAQRFVNTYLR